MLCRSFLADALPANNASLSLEVLTSGATRQRIARQRAIMREQSQEPLRTMTKVAVEEDRVSEYVVMPASLDISLKEWWSCLLPSHEVTVRYPHDRHGECW